MAKEQEGLKETEHFALAGGSGLPFHGWPFHGFCALSKSGVTPDFLALIYIGCKIWKEESA